MQRSLFVHCERLNLRGHILQNAYIGAVMQKIQSKRPDGHHLHDTK